MARLAAGAGCTLQLLYTLPPKTASVPDIMSCAAMYPLPRMKFVMANFVKVLGPVHQRRGHQAAIDTVLSSAMRPHYP
ncbi:hypothetical protein F4861DRAFT_493686 [Xylaria intraflava]|nr:hypothetical protein F4861DRAFT_493686 [Xylaria intraflava]